MKRSLNVAVIVGISLILTVSSASVNAQELVPASLLRTISQQLSEAGVPLSERQVYSLKNLEYSENIRREIFALLTDEQIAVLTTVPDAEPDITPVIRRINQQLSEAGVPLSERQLNYLMGLDDSINIRENILSVLTSAQQRVLNSQPAGKLAEYDILGLDGAEQQPEAFDILYQNHPNPFNPVTTISYNLAEPGLITVEVFDSNGQLVDRLVSEYQSAGRHSVVWNASSCASGIYMYRVTANGFADIKRMSFIK